MSCVRLQICIDFANVVFGDDTLKKSSAGGRKSNYNIASHDALESKKLKFMLNEMDCKSFLFDNIDCAKDELITKVS